MKKICNRQSNFELMRIISMVMIIIIHLIFHSVLSSTTNEKLQLVIDFLVLLCSVCVNSFILLTGYFQCENKFSIKKVVDILKSTWFYKVLFLIIALMISIMPITNIEIFEELLPIDMRDYWFINLYIVLYILSPYINILIKKMSQSEYRRLLIISFILFMVIPIVTNNRAVQNNGYTLINFCFLYLVGGYLRQYPINKNIHFKNYSNNKIKFIFLVIFICSLTVNFIIYQFSKQLVLFDHSLFQRLGNTIMMNYRSFSNPLIVIQSIAYFIYFGACKIKSNVINKIGKYVLDVYLIHENYYILSVLYIWIGVSSWLRYSGYIIVILTILVSIIILIICILLSIIKSGLFKFIESRKIYYKVSNKFYDYIKKF